MQDEAESEGRGAQETQAGKSAHDTRPLTSFVTLISGSFVSACVNERSRVILERSLARVACPREKINETKGGGEVVSGTDQKSRPRFPTRWIIRLCPDNASIKGELDALDENRRRFSRGGDLDYVYTVEYISRGYLRLTLLTAIRFMFHSRTKSLSYETDQVYRYLTLMENNA